ncbi:hypothetical protein GOODEAATRI_029771 [Goodea atripinnis]|uniref:Uncharacterized protein n=1 Tax=Goodea atripinnis TaxID=208336 RepID=A0ABV0P0Q4_9TELE
MFCSCFSGLLQFVKLCRHCPQQQVCHVSLRPDETIYPPCSFAQSASDYSKPSRFSLGLHNPRFYENRHSPLRSGLHWIVRAEEKNLLYRLSGLIIYTETGVIPTQQVAGGINIVVKIHKQRL